MVFINFSLSVPLSFSFSHSLSQKLLQISFPLRDILLHYHPHQMALLHTEDSERRTRTSQLVLSWHGKANVFKIYIPSNSLIKCLIQISFKSKSFQMVQNTNKSRKKFFLLLVFFANKNLSNKCDHSMPYFSTIFKKCKSIKITNLSNFQVIIVNL